MAGKQRYFFYLPGVGGGEEADPACAGSGPYFFGRESQRQVPSSWKEFSSPAWYFYCFGCFFSFFFFSFLSPRPAWTLPTHGTDMSKRGDGTVVIAADGMLVNSMHPREGPRDGQVFCRTSVCASAGAGLPGLHIRINGMRRKVAPSSVGGHHVIGGSLQRIRRLADTPTSDREILLPACSSWDVGSYLPSGSNGNIGSSRACSLPALRLQPPSGSRLPTVRWSRDFSTSGIPWADSLSHSLYIKGPAQINPVFFYKIISM